MRNASPAARTAGIEMGVQVAPIFLPAMRNQHGYFYPLPLRQSAVNSPENNAQVNGVIEAIEAMIQRKSQGGSKQGEFEF